jgi:lipoprotein-releasing system ATP-binding protein
MVLDMDSTDATNIEALVRMALRTGDYSVVRGVFDRMEHKPSELSGGEKQRVAVARALMNNPAVILADEPSGNLDSENQRELHQLFLKLRDEFHQTFVIVTHDTTLATLSDRVITMRDGLIVAS